MSATSISNDALIQTITLVCPDGYRLSGTRYAAQDALRGNLIVASATGVPQGFYRRFAEFASVCGYNVLTLDYRGIGASKPASLKGFEVSFLDWAQLDLAAAVEYMADDLPLYWVGHSYGGHALGLLPNQQKITAAYCFGTGAGWAGWMPTAEAFKVRLMWSAVFPVLVACKGYLAWSHLGMGEDLPRRVYTDWKRWCANPHYFFDDPSMSAVTERFADVRMPCLFANALDDLWAQPASRNAFIKGYRNATVTRLDLQPNAETGAIGHMGYFRATHSALWQQMLDWFASLEHTPKQPLFQPAATL